VPASPRQTAVAAQRPGSTAAAPPATGAAASPTDAEIERLVAEVEARLDAAGMALAAWLGGKTPCPVSAPSIASAPQMGLRHRARHVIGRKDPVPSESTAGRIGP
jgi:CubicO group peptidase (beta-lactamase class C family)